MQFVKKTIFYNLFIICILSVTGCIQYKEVEMVGITDIDIKNISKKGIEIDVGIQLKNPNNYKINIVDSDLELFVKDKKIGTAQVDNKVTLPKKSNETHRFIIVTKIEDATATAIPLLMGLFGNTIEIQIKGDVKASAKGIGKKFPVDFKEKVKL